MTCTHPSLPDELEHFNVWGMNGKCMRVLLNVSDLGGSVNNGGLREISTMMKNTANFMDKGTSILSKLTQRFGGRVKK